MKNDQSNAYQCLFLQVDLAHLLAARDQELRTVSAEVIPGLNTKWVLLLILYEKSKVVSLMQLADIIRMNI